MFINAESPLLLLMLYYLFGIIGIKYRNMFFFATNGDPAAACRCLNVPTHRYQNQNCRGKIGVHNIFVNPESRRKPTSVNTINS